MQCIALDIVAPNVQGSSMKRRRSCPCFHAETPAEEEEHVKAQGWAERVDDRCMARDAWPLVDSIANSPTMPYAGGGLPSDGGEADPPGEAEEQETESDDDDNGVERKRPVRLARVIENEITTLQCHGLDHFASLEALIMALNEVGLGGLYNFVHIPRSFSGGGLGYAFISCINAESAALLVERWEGAHSDDSLFARRARFRGASRQGYAAYVTERSLRKYNRLRNRSLWPLVMTRDGATAVFGTPSAISAVLTRRE
mmetsp:Transcript_5877/g.12894  ORF Transcript_5877/g.12894 Transcript_5877/m.12894 type:complete len:257 (-) Transcript_5877:99-869(-)